MLSNIRLILFIGPKFINKCVLISENAFKMPIIGRKCRNMAENIAKSIRKR